MMIWPSRHFERFHDWKTLRAKRADGRCVCEAPVDPSIIDEFDRAEWCSQACFNDVGLRCGFIKPPLLVHERDLGICAACGCDAGTATRVLQRIRQVERWDFRLSYAENHERTAASRDAAFVILDAWGVSAETRSLWDADHIVPVVEGGGGCGLDNYRTLCVTCHRVATSDLATVRAERRRATRSVLPIACESLDEQGAKRRL